MWRWQAAWLAPLVFKTSVGLDKVLGGFDSHAPPPTKLLPCDRSLLEVNWDISCAIESPNHPPIRGNAPRNATISGRGSLSWSWDCSCWCAAQDMPRGLKPPRGELPGNGNWFERSPAAGCNASIRMRRRILPLRLIRARWPKPWNAGSNRVRAPDRRG